MRVLLVWCTLTTVVVAGYRYGEAQPRRRFYAVDHRLNKYRVSGLYGRGSADSQVSGSVVKDLRRNDDGTYHGAVVVSGEGVQNVSVSGGLGDVQGGAAASVSGGGNLSAEGDVGRKEDGSHFAGGRSGVSGHGRVIGGVGVGNFSVGGELGSEGNVDVLSSGSFHRKENGDVEGGGAVGVEAGGKVSAAGGIGDLQGHGDIGASGAAEIAGDFSVSKNENGTYDIESEAEVSKSVGLSADLGVGSLHGGGDVGVAKHLQGTLNSEVGVDKEGLYRVGADTGLTGGGKADTGIYLGKGKNTLHGRGDVEVQGDAGITGKTALGKDHRGDLHATAEVGGRLGGSLGLGAELGKDEGKKVEGGVNVGGQLEGKVTGGIHKTKEKGLVAEGKVSGSSGGGFNFKLWPFG